MIKDTWLKVTKKYASLCKGGTNKFIERIHVKGANGIVRVDYKNLIAMCDRPYYGKPGSLIFDYNADEPMAYVPEPSDYSIKIPDEVLLDVRGATQRNNWTKYQGSPHRQCCLTSVVIAIDELTDGELTRMAKAKGYLEPEDIYGEMLAKHDVDTTNAPGHIPVLREELGIEAYFTNSLSDEELRAIVGVARVPVPIGVKWKVSGHWKTVIGYTLKKVKCWNPYGHRVSMYQIVEKAGIETTTWDFMDKIWTDLGDEAGWGIVITSVRGVSTGAQEAIDAVNAKK